MNDDDIFASAGGSLLNDLLSDLDAAVASSRPDDPNDDILASLERELASSYAKPPPGMGMSSASRSAAAFVVGHQSNRAAALAPPPSTPAATASAPLGDPDDAWAAALSQFGNMSLAADFLAADTAKKEKEANVTKSGGDDDGILGDFTSDLVGKLFEDDDDYDAEEEVVLGKMMGGKSGAGAGDDSVDVTGGLMALLGASRANTAAAATGKEEKPLAVKEQPTKEEVKPVLPKEMPENELTSPKGAQGTKAPPPSPMFPPQPHPMGYPMPPGGPPGPHGMPQPPHPMMLNHPMMPPPMHMPPPHPMMGMGRGMPPMGMHPMMMGPPGHPMHGPGHPPFHGPPPHPGMHPMPQPGSNILPPPTQMRDGPPKGGAKPLFKNNDFPALGEDAKEEEENAEETKEADVSEEERVEAEPVTPAMVAKVIFNNPNPSAHPISASHVASSLMPSRDICYIVHSMLRPLQSLDAYNDDYYHWSFVDRKSRNMLMLGGMGPGLKNIPNPVWKEVKVLAKERETKYREAVETRAKDWAEEKKSLGRTVRTNVKRPKALLTTPVLNKEKADTDPATEAESKAESDYELEQQRNRVHMWKARVAIDKGYTAFLSLTELRRLIQANAGAPQLVNELMSDVKSNVDLMHASFGIAVKMDSDGGRKTEVDKTRLGSTLSLPKGRVLCARVIEGGILPHQSACEILPVALFSIFSTALPAPRDGEDRLLRALTGLVLTVQPSVDPAVLCRCLDMSIMVGQEGKMSNITGNRTRMELLHSILSRGKAVCGDTLADVWAEKEKAFMDILSSHGGK